MGRYKILNVTVQTPLVTVVRLFLGCFEFLGVRAYQWIFDLCVGYSRLMDISIFREILKRLVHAVFLKTKVENSFRFGHHAKSKQGRRRGGALKKNFSHLVFIFIFLNMFIISAASAQTAEQCYDTANVGEVGQAGWAGCEGMLIVSQAQLYDAASNNTFAITSGGVNYTFSDTANNIFTGQVESMSELFQVFRVQRRYKLLGRE